MRRRVAILGGGIGAKHLKGYLLNRDRFEVARICDLNLELASDLARRAGAAVPNAKIDAAIFDPSIDIIDICLPPPLHAPVAERALKAKKHVICEKPIAGNVRDAERISKIASRQGKLLIPVFQYRFGRAFFILEALRRADLLGKPLAASFETHWDRRTDYYQVPWRGTWDGEFGGAILTHAIHAHDTAACTMGSAVQVAAFIDTKSNPIETDDCAAVCFKTCLGALATSSISLGAAGNSSRIRLVFEYLTAESASVPYAFGTGGWTFAARSADVQEQVDRIANNPGDCSPEGFAGLFASVAEHLDGKHGLFLPTPDDGIRSIEFATAAYLSARTRKTVSLPLDRDLAICGQLAPDVRR